VSVLVRREPAGAAPPPPPRNDLEADSQDCQGSPSGRDARVYSLGWHELRGSPRAVPCCWPTSLPSAPRPRTHTILGAHSTSDAACRTGRRAGFRILQNRSHGWPL